MGLTQLLLSIYGTVPSYFQNSVYRIPIEVWVPKTYPQAPPIVFVTPTQDMMIQPGNYVDANGKFYNPYLSSWQPSVPSFNLVNLLNLLSECFSKEPPVYGRPAQHIPQGPAQPAPSQLNITPPPLPEKERLPSGDPYRSVRDGILKTTSLPPPLPPLPAQTKSPIPDFLDQNGSNESSLQTKELTSQIQQRVSQVSETQILPFIARVDSKIGQMNNSVGQFEQILNYEKSLLNNYLQEIAYNDQLLTAKIEEINKVIVQADQFKEPELDEIICAETVVYNQLYQLVAEIRAIEDTVYCLAQLHDKGKISLQLFMKYSRELARDQFKKKALVKKISDLIK